MKNSLAPICWPKCLFLLAGLGLLGCTAQQNSAAIPAYEVSPDVKYLWPEQKKDDAALVAQPTRFENKTAVGVNNGIIAVANDRVITLKEFDAEFFRALQQKNFTSKEDELYNDLLNNMIDQLLLLDLAYQKKIEVLPQRVDDELEYTAKKHPEGWDGLRRELEEQKSSIEAMKEKLKESLMLRDLRGEIIGRLNTPSPKEIQASYEKYNSEFEIPEKRNLAMITIFESDYKNEARLVERASKKILERLQTEDFTQVLLSNSSDGKGDGRLQGFVAASDLAEPIAKIAFLLEDGSWSGPHNMPGVVFFVKCQGIQPKQLKTLDEVQDIISNNLLSQMRYERISNALNDIKKSSYIRKLSHQDYVDYRKSLVQ